MALLKTKEDFDKVSDTIEVTRDDEPIYTSIWTSDYHHAELPDEVRVNGVRCCLQQTSYHPFILSYSTFPSCGDRMTIMFQAAGADEEDAVKAMKEKLERALVR